MILGISHDYIHSIYNSTIWRAPIAQMKFHLSDILAYLSQSIPMICHFKDVYNLSCRTSVLEDILYNHLLEFLVVFDPLDRALTLIFKQDYIYVLFITSSFIFTKSSS